MLEGWGEGWEEGCGDGVGRGGARRMVGMGRNGVGWDEMDWPDGMGWRGWESSSNKKVSCWRDHVSLWTCCCHELGRTCNALQVTIKSPNHTTSLN